MPELSIIVTAYNIENYIEECLRSITQQTFTDFEVLVVDDGSTDSTAELIEEFAERDSRFTPVLLRENSPGGVATAANAGLELARGTWVGFVDGDDVVEPHMFAALVRAGTTHSTDLAMCQYREFIDGTDESRAPADARRWDDLREPSYALDETRRKQFLRFIPVPWRKLYRRDLIKKSHLRFPEGDYFYEDNPFHWFALLSAHSIALVPEVLCHHRIGRPGQTMAVADAKLFKIFRHHDTIRDWLTDQGLQETYGVTLLGWAISQMEWISERTPHSLRPQLYETLAPIIAQYSRTQVAAALHEGRKGLRAQQLATALSRGKRRRFLAALNGRPDSTNKFRIGIYHLRHSGVRRTARMTQEVIAQRTSSSGLGRFLPARAAAAASRAMQNSSAASTQDELMFALAALQNQVARLTQTVDSLHAQSVAAQRAARSEQDDGYGSAEDVASFSDGPIGEASATRVHSVESQVRRATTSTASIASSR